MFNLLRAIALLSDIKIVEETKWLFDEFTQKVFDTLPEPFKGVKDYVLEDNGLIAEDLYDMWYYYINSPVMRYVNNYYEFEKYDLRVFEKNMYKALDNYARTNKEKLIDKARHILIHVSELSNNINILDVNGNRYKIEFIWVAEPDACKLCRNLDGKIVTPNTRISTHWNCRCHLEEKVTIISPDGNILNEIVKIL